MLLALPTRLFCTQHEILRIDTQEGGTSALCDEPNQDQMRDSASLLGSQIVSDGPSHPEREVLLEVMHLS